jgi:hypothetical protein
VTPANLWEWVGTGNWSTPANWDLNGGANMSGMYPGQAGLAAGDQVLFDDATAGACTLDVAGVGLATLQFTGWGKTLTMNQSLLVTGSGNFSLFDGSTISIADGMNLMLLDLGPLQQGTNVWNKGNITGGKGLYVTGSELDFRGTTGILGTMLYVQKDVPNNINGFVTLALMTDNLILNGASNFIDVGNGGYLELNQQIPTNGQQGKLGGLVLGPAHTGSLQAVQVEAGGEMDRGGVGSSGVVNEVKIAGTVYNKGGIVDVMAGGILNLTAVDGNGYSYWQTANGLAELIVGAGGNLAVSGTIEIDAGTLQLTAPSGGAAEELDGTALTFGNLNATFLNIVDQFPGMTGQVTVGLAVNLAANTTTTMNFMGGINKADLLDVHNGTLTLAGNLSLVSSNGLKATQPLNFLDDSGFTPNMTGNFASITDSLNGTDTGEQVANNPQLIYYQVTMK